MFILSIVVVGLVVEQDLAALLATGLEPKWHHSYFIHMYVCHMVCIYICKLDIWNVYTSVYWTYVCSKFVSVIT